MSLLAYIPSPHTGVVHLGPLTLHMYGLTLLVGDPRVHLADRPALGAMGGDCDLVLRVAVWGVAFGVIGARLYHDAHLVERGAEPEVEGRLRGLAGRPRRLGRDPARRARRLARRAPRGLRRLPLPGRGRARPAARAGDRPHRQLVEPGALRQADDAAVGARRSTWRTARVASTSSTRPSTRPSSTS